MKHSLMFTVFNLISIYLFMLGFTTLVFEIESLPLCLQSFYLLSYYLSMVGFNTLGEVKPPCYCSYSFYHIIYLTFYLISYLTFYLVTLSLSI